MQGQPSNESSKHVHEIARPCRDSGLELVNAVGMPVRSAKQKRPPGELDQRSAERTAELANANDAIRTEIVESRNIKAHLLESEVALHSSLLFAADRPRAKLADAKPASEQMLGGISPIGETSPVKARLSSE